MLTMRLHHSCVNGEVGRGTTVRLHINAPIFGLKGGFRWIVTLWIVNFRAFKLKRLPKYSCVLNTSHTILGDIPDFYHKLVCITRHIIQFYQRPGWNTEHINSLLMWQWHHYYFEVTREGLRPGCNSRYGILFTQRPGWNKRIWGKIQWVLNRSPVTCIQD